MTAPLKIPNKTARHLWLHLQGLSKTPTGSLDVMGIIRDLGFVQLDTIQTVARAHHHIIWSRNQNYREDMLNPLLQNERAIFEHFTHDASVIPMEFLPMWRRQFRRKKERWDSRTPPHRGDMDAIKARIAREGALSTHAFDTKVEGPKEMWARPPHKLALDYMWYAGELATCYRQNFAKYYNLAERVFPADLAAQDIPDADQVDWLCRAALDRMGFGTPGDIQRFWEAMTAAEAKTWAEAAHDLIPVEIQSADGSWTPALAAPQIEDMLATLPRPTTRLRILNPFDPVIRDRNRLARLFGFEYRNEMFVPAAKRVWGYYVFPMLEGDRMVGRVEMKADRKAGTLTVLQFWTEPKVHWTQKRFDKLDTELNRMARFIGVRDVVWTDPASAARV